MKLYFTITLIGLLSQSNDAFSLNNGVRSALTSADTFQRTCNVGELVSYTDRWSKHETRLFMADDDDDEEEEEEISDELSKLIGRRASIARKTPKESPPSGDDDTEFIDPTTASLYEGKSGMDMFEMPDFKTSRPLRTPKETEDKARGGDGKDEEEFYIDFQADYDDENDLHIPNRIGFCTKPWGDVSEGFKAGKKLKKKEIKRGRYLAGDLQVRKSS